jgi:alpha-aminoadipic semialdehyde synthase
MPTFIFAPHASQIADVVQVGVPAAIATQLLLEGRIAARGVVRPMDPAVYEPMLTLLEAEGIVIHEKRIA